MDQVTVYQKNSLDIFDLFWKVISFRYAYSWISTKILHPILLKTETLKVVNPRFFVYGSVPPDSYLCWFIWRRYSPV